MKRATKLWAGRKKAVGRAPAWLKTAAIAKPSKRPAPRGTFGPASDVVRIDPKTGKPIGDK